MGSLRNSAFFMGHPVQGIRKAPRAFMFNAKINIEWQLTTGTKFNADSRAKQLFDVTWMSTVLQRHFHKFCVTPSTYNLYVLLLWSRWDQPFGRYSRKCLNTQTDWLTDWLTNKHGPSNYFSPTHQRKSSFIESSMLKYWNVHSLRFWIITRDAEPWHFWSAPAPAPAPGKHSGSDSGSGSE